MIENEWTPEIKKLREENKKLKMVVRKLGIVAFVFILVPVFVVSLWIILECAS